ncbi:hypothetical protein NN561_003078 [Cricetulus griseus]
MGWVWGRGRRGELSPGCSPGGEAAAPRTPLVRATHSSSRALARDPEVAPAARPASVPRFPDTARKFRSRTPGAHPHPALPGRSPRPRESGGCGMKETLPHKHQPQVLFSLRAASSLAPPLHTRTSCTAPRPSPAEVRSRAREGYFGTLRNRRDTRGRASTQTGFARYSNHDLKI